MVEVYKRGGSIEACMEIIEYETLSVEPARFKKKKVFRIRIIHKTLNP